MVPQKQMPEPNEPNAFQKFIRWKMLKERVPLSRVTIWRMVRDGQFPKPVRIGQRGTAWIASEIEHWMQEKMEAR